MVCAPLSGIAGKPCEPNLRIDNVAIWDLRFGALGPKHLPKGPNLEKIQASLNFSSELEIFKRATHQTPIFCGEFWRSGLKISSDLEIFKRD